MLQSAVVAQLLGDGEHVDRLFLHAKVLNGLIDHLVGRVVETVGLENVVDKRVGVFFEHERAKHGFLDFSVLRLNFSEFGNQLRLMRRLVAPIVLTCFFYFKFHSFVAALILDLTTAKIS